MKLTTGRPVSNTPSVVDLRQFSNARINAFAIELETNWKQTRHIDGDSDEVNCAELSG
jgi:hypothetical protein